MNWINVKDRLPELKTYYDKEFGGAVREVTKEVIVTDTESVWVEYYSEDLGFHQSITHFMYLPQPPKELEHGNK